MKNKVDASDVGALVVHVEAVDVKYVWACHLRR